MNLIIDIGNTVAKIAVFKDKDIVEVFYDSNQTLENLPDICTKYAVEKAIAATVIDLNEQVSAQLARLPVPLLWLNETTSLLGLGRRDLHGHGDDYGLQTQINTS